LKRNPDYWDKDFAFLEQVDMPIVLEYSAALAQFKAGNIYTMGSRSPNLGVRQEEILSVAREEPRILIYPSDLRGGGGTLAFGFLPGSPFHDERVRQAVSMAIDRDLHIDTFNNVSLFEKEGLPMEARWNTALKETEEAFWLDPKSKDFGPNSKYFQYDVAEAKKLLAAAGYPNGIENVTSSYVTGSQLDHAKPAEVMDRMIREIGITSRVNSVDYAKEYIPLYRDGRGQHDGWSYITAIGASFTGDPVGELASEWWSKGG
jgi:ABC-type transport system substrate-binding protein